MKVAPYLIITLLALSPLLGFISTEKEHGFSKENMRIEVSFDSQFDFDALVALRETLAKENISLSYSKIEYNQFGALESLSFQVDCNDGFSGNASKEQMNNQKRWGFYRDYSKDAKSPFGTGGLD